MRSRWVTCGALLGAALLSASGCGSGSGSGSGAASVGGDVYVEPIPVGVEALATGDARYADGGFAALESEGYWYSRYNLGALVMMSGNGETFMPDMSMVQAMVAMVSDSYSMATPPMNPALFKRVYDANSPAFVNAPDAEGLLKYRWAPLDASVEKTSLETFG